MAGQTQALKQPAQPHGGVVPFMVMNLSLSDAICAVGIPSLEIGLAAAKAGLVKIGDGEGTIHFEWNKEALDKRGVQFLESMLLNLRAAAGVSQ